MAALSHWRDSAFIHHYKSAIVLKPTCNAEAMLTLFWVSVLHVSKACSTNPRVQDCMLQVCTSMLAGHKSVAGCWAGLQLPKQQAARDAQLKLLAEAKETCHLAKSLSRWSRPSTLPASTAADSADKLKVVLEAELDALMDNFAGLHKLVEQEVKILIVAVVVCHYQTGWGLCDKHAMLLLCHHTLLGCQKSPGNCNADA